MAGKTVIDELVTILGFDLDPKSKAKVDAFNKGIKEVYEIAKSASLALIGAATSVLFFGEKAAQSGASIYRFSQMTGMSTKAIQQWMYAAGQISGNKDSILGDIQMLTGALNPIMPGQFNQGLFLLFGNRLKDMKDAGQVLKETSKLFHQMTPQRAMQWGQQIGFSPETTMLLRVLGPGGIEKMFAKTSGRLLSEKELAAAYRFSQLWADVKDRLEKVSIRLGIMLLPLLTKVIEKLIRWWETHQKLIHSTYDKAIDGLKKIAGWVSEAVKYTKEFIAIWLADKFIIKLGLLLGSFKTILATVNSLKLAMFGLAAAETAVGTAGAAAASGGGLVAMLATLAKFLPPPVMAALAALAVMAPVDTGGGMTGDEETDKVKNFKGLGINGMVDKTLAAVNRGLRTQIDPRLSGRAQAMEMLQKNGTDPAILERLRQAQGGGLTQHNNIVVQAPDPYSAGSEVIHRLERLPRTNFQVITAGAGVQ